MGTYRLASESMLIEAMRSVTPPCCRHNAQRADEDGKGNAEQGGGLHDDGRVPSGSFRETADDLSGNCQMAAAAEHLLENDRPCLAHGVGSPPPRS